MLNHEYRWTPPAPDHYVIWAGHHQNAELEAVLNYFSGTWVVEDHPDHPGMAVRILRDGVQQAQGVAGMTLLLEEDGIKERPLRGVPYPDAWS